MKNTIEINGALIEQCLLDSGWKMPLQEIEAASILLILENGKPGKCVLSWESGNFAILTTLHSGRWSLQSTRILPEHR